MVDYKRTIMALAANDMNIAETARALHYHRNTIPYHIEKIKEETGLDPLKFYDLVKLVAMVGGFSENSSQRDTTEQ